MRKASETFRFRLSDAMEARRLTQQALSSLSGIGRTQIAKYLGGVTTPNLDNLAALALALGVSSDSLLGINPMPAPPKPRTPTKEEMAAFIVRELGVGELLAKPEEA